MSGTNINLKFGHREMSLIGAFVRCAVSMRMNFKHLIDLSRLLLLGVLLIASSLFNVAAQTNAIAKPKAPTGFYVSVAEISPTISMRFDTNGQYQVEIGPCGPLGCMSQKGKWKWDEQKEEFLLSTKDPVGLWHFEFRRFRVDKQEPDTLEWASLNRAGNVLGVYPTVRFKRQGD